MTREQLAAMLFRYADKVADVDTSKRADLRPMRMQTT